jgi:integrase
MDKMESRLEEFFAIYPKATTKRAYRSAVYAFLDCMFDTTVRKIKFYVTDEERAEYEQLAAQYLSDERDYYKDLLKFSASMNGRAPLGVRAVISSVKEFLRYNKVTFTEDEIRSLSKKMPKGKAKRTAETDIEVDMLKKMMAHMDLKAKALTLVLASSGMRIGEALQITLEDINLTEMPPQITIRGEYTKSGDTRVTFISQEARELVIEWLRIRDQYLEGAREKNKGLVGYHRSKRHRERERVVEDRRLFPFTDANARGMWDNAIKKIGLYSKDLSTNRSQIRIHGLRRFFRSQLALSCPIDIVEALMGHEGYLTEAYRRYTRKQMGEYYLKAEQHVTILGSADISEMKGKLEDTQAAVKGYKNLITEQAEEIGTLRRKVEALERREEERKPYDAALTKLLKQIIDNPKILDELARMGRD